MRDGTTRRLSAGALRAELSARGLGRGTGAGTSSPLEVSYGPGASVVFAPEEGEHGNFLPASYRRILARPAWARRLEKAYTGAKLMPRAGDRQRAELDCATSSDALLMNVFCYPGVLRRPSVCARLGVDAGLEPEFGVRATLPMARGEVDRTEFDMRVGAVLVEAKLTETGFGRASRERVERYVGVEESFDLEALPRSGSMFAGYQLVRGLLAAAQSERDYLVLLDGRRRDLQEVCFRVLGACRDGAMRQRFRLQTWQELAGAMPGSVRTFLGEKYGIFAG